MRQIIYSEPSYLDRLPNLNLPKLALSFSEIISLCMLAGESVVFKGTEIDRHIETAISKLNHFVPEQTQTELAKLKRIFISKTMDRKITPVRNTSSKKTWSRTQSLHDNPDGSLTLTMTTSGRRDVKRWIMSFGKEARLLEPEDLKREIEYELKIILSGAEKR